MTLLFSDLVGSTLLSERVEPEQLRDLFSSYRGAARDAVTRYGGNLVQFSRDGILAAFGHPIPTRTTPAEPSSPGWTWSSR